MKRMVYLLPVVFFLYLASLSFGAGTTVITEETYSSMNKVTFDWQSNSSGDVDTTGTEYYSAIVWRVVFDPDTGSLKPSNLYDVKIYDSDTIDICDNGGSNLPNNLEVQLTPVTLNKVYTGISNTQLRLNVANAGSCKAGKVIVYLR